MSYGDNGDSCVGFGLGLIKLAIIVIAATGIITYLIL